MKNLATNPTTNARVYVDDAGHVRVQHEDGTSADGAVIVVALASDLRSKSGSSRDIAFASGLTAEDDGQGGFFTWDTASAADDGVDRFNPPSGGTAAGWKRAQAPSTVLHVAPMDWTTFIGIVNANANIRPVQMGAGTWTMDVPAQNLASGTAVQLSPGVLVNSTLTSDGGFFDSSFNAQITATANTGTVNNDVVLNSKTIIVAMSTKPVVGNALRVEHGTSQAIYDITAVTGVASPWTVTTERPVVWPFVATDTVVELSAYPKNIMLDGNNGMMTGTGTQAVWAAGAYRFKSVGVHYDDALGAGALSGSPYGYDVSCRECVLEDFTCKHTNASAAVYLQSNERSVVRNGVLRKGGGAVALFDCYQSGIEECWAYDTTVTAAFQLGQIDGTTFGSKECWINGGGIIGFVGIGVYVNVGTGCRVEDFAAESGATALAIAGATDTFVTNFRAKTMSTAGINIDGSCDGVFINGAQLEGCDSAFKLQSGAKNVFAQNVKVSGCTTNALDNAGDLTINGFVGDIAAADGTGFITSSGTLTMRNAHVTSVKAAASVVQVSGGEAWITGMRVEMTIGANQTALYLTGGTTHLEDVKCSGPASAYGLYVGNGATAYVGRSCDFDACGTPITLVGSGKAIVAQSGSTSKAVTTADVTLTFNEARCTLLTTTGVLDNAHNVILPAIAGMTWDVFCNNTGAFTTTFKTAAGTGIVVAQGKFARLACDGTNIVRVSPDT